MGISAPYLYDMEHGNRRVSDQHRAKYMLGLTTLKSPAKV